MRDINRAERLLSLFTSPDGAAGIVGDLSEERGQRGSVWFWRQVLGTVFSLCRGALIESRGAVLLLVALGLALTGMATPVISREVVHLWQLAQSGAHPWILFQLILLTTALFWWLCAFILGGALITASPRRGMVACTLLAGLQVLLSLTCTVFVPADFSIFLRSLILYIEQPYLWLGHPVLLLPTPLFLLLGGAMFRQRQLRKLLPTG